MLAIIQKAEEWIKKIVLLLFMSLFDEELDAVEPEVDKFFANLLRPYL